MSRHRLALAAVLTASTLTSTGALAASADPTPPAPAPAAGRATAPAGWRVLDLGGSYRITRLPVDRVPVTDARPHVVAAGTDLGPATVAPDGAASVVVDRLPAGLDRLELRYGAATEAELVARTDAGAGRSAAQRVAPAPTPGIATATYRAGSIKVPGMKTPLGISGRVVAPASGTNLPVVLLLHGRHAWCVDAWADWPCKAPNKPVPSLEGYRYAQETLAKKGYFTVSIDANAVNAQDGWLPDAGMPARSALVRKHLELLAAWKASGSAPFAKQVRAGYDVKNTLVMGHSRGGEGAALAAVEQQPAKGYAIKGLMLLAPTNFFHTSASTTPTVTLVPACDGDVANLDGAGYPDAAQWYGRSHALSSLLYLPGANHNYFNTEWTPGAPTGLDDGEATGCAPKRRLSPAAQRSVGRDALVATADRLLKGTGPVLDGSTPLPAPLNKQGIVTSGTGGDRRLVADPATSGWRVTGATVCRGEACAPRTGSLPASAHWNTLPEVDPAGWAWSPAKPFVTLAPTSADLSAGQFLDVRMVLSPNASMKPVLHLVDTTGRHAALNPVGPATRTGVSGDRDAVGGRWIAQNVRFTLPARGVDLARVRTIGLTADKATGTAVVLDIATAGPRAAAPVPAPTLLRLPTTATVKEGNAPWTYRVRGTLSAPAPVRLSGISAVTGPEKNEVARFTAAPGTRELTLPMTVPGNTVWNGSFDLDGGLYVRGPVLVATPNTRVTVVEDDPRSRATVTKTATTKPGGKLTWTFTLDRPTGGYTIVSLAAQPATNEIQTSDLTPEGREAWSIPSDKDMPLSEAGAAMFVVIEPGQKQATLSLPLAAKAVVGRQVLLNPEVEGADLPAGIKVTGTVTK